MKATSEPACLLDSLTKKVLRPDEAEAFESEMAAFTEGEHDVLLREIRRQALLVEALALKRLAVSEAPHGAFGPSDEVREKSFAQAVTLLKLFQAQTEGIRRWRALPEGTVVNQVIVQAPENQNCENGRTEGVVDAEVIQEKQGVNRQLECVPDRAL